MILIHSLYVRTPIDLGVLPIMKFIGVYSVLFPLEPKLWDQVTKLGRIRRGGDFQEIVYDSVEIVAEIA
jgi:hypothetical protein